jgi:uncharacterized membrane protein YcaP (DUF421 family)
MRIMGKREIGQLQPFELAITLIISELVVIPMQNTGVPLVNGVIPILAITASQLLFSYLTAKNEKIQKLISGTYTVMIENGRLVEKNLRSQNYNITELMQQLRMNGIDKLNDVDYGILETNGQLSVILKPVKRPATAEDMLVNKEYEGLPIDIILDGKIVEENLNKINITKEEIMKKVELENLKIEDVFYANINDKKEFYIQKKESNEVI